MQTGEKAVVWFNEVTKNDIPTVGGKGANLGEMTNAGIPVPFLSRALVFRSHHVYWFGSLLKERNASI